MAEDFSALGFVLNSDGSFTRIPGAVEPRLPANPTFEDGVASRDISIDPTRDLWVRVFYPQVELTELPVVVFFHGGGFILLNAASVQFQTFCHQVSKRLGFVVISVNYRLAPEHRLPAAYEDGFSALQWLAGVLRGESTINEANLNLDISKIFLMGDSAGANLAHHVATRAAREHQSLGYKLAGQILIQPFFGGVSRSESEVKFATGGEVITVDVCDFFWKLALPPGADRDHSFCNVLLSLREVLEELKSEFSDGLVPRTLVVAGGRDLLSNRGTEFAKIMEELEMKVQLVVYEEADHAFYANPGSKFTPHLLDDIARFCSEILEIKALVNASANGTLELGRGLLSVKSFKL